MQTDASLLDAPSVESTMRTVNGVDLHVVTAGDPEDPLVVLLHGFPDFWYGWRDQIEPLVDAGYRVLVPDQRGYNLSDSPESIDAYRIEALTDDIRALIETEGRDSAHVIGHDWGAIVAWELAIESEVVDRLGIVNVPHPRAFQEALRSSAEQLRRSWYVFFFQLPRIPEWVLGHDDYRPLGDALLESGSAAAFSDVDIERYRASWAATDSLSGLVNWYRAAGLHPTDLLLGDSSERAENTAYTQDEAIDHPTLIVWGEGDTALIPDLAPMSRQYCPNGRVERFPDATHWVHQEEAEAVTALLLEHLSE
jgi:pimeloyl-ACP methyl ester carboxylesterase